MVAGITFWLGMGLMLAIGFLADTEGSPKSTIWRPGRTGRSAWR